MWVLDLLPEIESDLSALHRIEDPYPLAGSRMIRLIERLPAYDGAVRAALLARQAPAPVQQEDVWTAPASAPSEVLTLEGSTLAAMAGDDPNLVGIEYTG